MTITESVTRAFAKTRRDVLARRWLKGALYTLVKVRTRGEPVRYQWLTDGGREIGEPYGSLEMAEVNFGVWTA